MADAQPQLPQAVAFVGLGAMGVGIAGNLHAGLVSQGGAALTVWNRTAAVAQKHAADHGTVAVAELTEVAAADVIVSCLPTSAQVRDVATTLAPQLKSGTLWIDCTSGEPVATRAIASEILSPAGVALVDCPVSGGPSGAASGQLTAMVGGEPEAVARATSLISLFAKKNTVPCGGLGCACAVKSVNNALNVSHLALAGEGLLALAKFGVAPEVALRAINGSSGRSLQTQERLPQAVLTRNFDYGFKLGLMLKDVDIALSDVLPPEGGEGGGAPAGGVGGGGGSGAFQRVRELLSQAVALEGYDEDYTKVVRPLEASMGIELHNGSEAGQPYVATSGKTSM